MSRIYNYRDRKRDRIVAGLGVFGAAAAGLGFFLRNPAYRSRLGEFALNSLHRFGMKVENKAFGGAVKNILRSKISSIEDIPDLETSGLANIIRSFKRLVNVDLHRQTRRSAGIDHLVQNGWSREDAELVFSSSTKSYDILSPISTHRLLNSRHYRKNILPRINVNKTESEIYKDIVEARKFTKKGIFRAYNEKLYKEANKALADRLEQQYLKDQEGGLVDKVLRNFGISRLKLKDTLHDEKFLTSFDEIFSSKKIQTTLDLHPNLGIEKIRSEAKKVLGRNLTEQENLFIDATLSLHIAGKENFREIAENLPLELLKSESSIYNIGPIRSLFASKFENFSKDFIVPIAPGIGGISPLRFFPWNRAASRDFAGTLSAGTKQAELFRAANSAVRESLFNDDFSLKRDVYYVGDTIFSSIEEKTKSGIKVSVVNLSEGVPWEIKDVRFGIHSDFFRARTHVGGTEEAEGGALSWIGNNPIRRILDFLGIGRQYKETKLGKSFSVLGKFLWPTSERYKDNPFNALRNILGGGDSIEDIESLIIGIKKAYSIPDSVKASDVFANINLRNLKIPRGFRELIESDFSEDSLSQALLEIDAIVSRDFEGKNFKFFDPKKPPIFRSSKIKMMARRFSQDRSKLLSEQVMSDPNPDVSIFENLFGEGEKLSGFERVRQVFYEEIFSRLSVHPNAQEMSETIAANVFRMGGITEEERREVIGSIWAQFNEQFLSSDFLKRHENARILAENLRENVGGFTEILQPLVQDKYGGLSQWTELEAQHLTTEGLHLYAVPKGKNAFSAFKDAVINKDFSNIKAFLLSESVPVEGGASNYGLLYNTAFRLNDMLSHVGLGLADRDMSSITNAYKNILFKRVLPAFAAVEGWKYLNREQEDIAGINASTMFSNIRAKVALAGSWVTDILGLKETMKNIVELTPGLGDWWAPRTYEEQQEYLTEGREPVRSSRWWLIGSRQPFAGGKVSYWSPSWYRLASSDWQAASNVDLDSAEYWKHSILPTPRYPFSPIKRFLDPYWWEKKHEKDRPYLITGEMFEPSTLWGNLLNATIGKIIKPTKRMHKEYWEGEGGSGSGKGVGGSKGDLGFGVGSEGSDPNNYKYSDVMYQVDRAITQVRDIVGIYGFMGKSVLENLGFDGIYPTTILASPSKAYGYERRFWDRKYGGLGGEINEFWRRVIQHQRSDIKEFNPVKNTMPDWLPGDEDITDFQHGDPYIKIPMGEVRLPGEAYERIYLNKGYDVVERALILADVSPWSDKFREAIKDLRQEIKREKNPERVKYLKDKLEKALLMARERKKSYRIYDYRFSGKIKTETLIVKNIIDANTIEVEGSDHPVRLSGVRLFNKDIENFISKQNIAVKKGEKQIDAFYNALGIYPGKKIKVAFDSEDNISKDVLETRRGAIFVDGVNINRKLLREGYGVERKNDYSGPGVLTRFSLIERIYGRIIEKLAHLDTPFHTKLWNVRSALERYKREQIYGTQAGDWSHPFKTYVQPTLESISSKNPIIAGLYGGFLGSLFFKSRQGKILGAKVGAGIGAGLSLLRLGFEGLTGRAYIPGRVRKRRELEEYYDTLKYVKYTRLYHKYAGIALRKEGSDVNSLLELQRTVDEDKKALKRAKKDKDQTKVDELNKRIQQNIEEINRRALKLGPSGLKAIAYYNQSKSTLYGAPLLGPLRNVMLGLPKYERELFFDIISKGTRKEKEEFFMLLSNREKRKIGPYLGIPISKIPPKEKLTEYFKNHQLPDKSWVGWAEGFNLDSARIIAALREGVTPIEMGIYPGNIDQAKSEVSESDVPVMKKRTRDVKKVLEDLLGSHGIKNISIDLEMMDGENRSDIDIEIRHDRTEEVARFITNQL